ncbi:MAG: AraC family transcriptional regulator [Erysipelotrichales bacterium]|nr:AraC family transcriptional regulator [Erysipelotrichales bacterium]
MNIFEAINKVTDYIEEHLEEEISYKKLGKLAGMNDYVLNRVFSLLCNISLSSYIRNRRLSRAGFDLYNRDMSIMDIAIKYGYENATTFSRAFYNFHNIKPSLLKKDNIAIKNYPIIHFNEQLCNNNSIEYKIVELNSFKLYGKFINSDEIKINDDAPNFWQYMNKKYKDIHGNIDYGAVVTLPKTHNIEEYEYWILYKNKIKGFQELTIPKSKYLVFRINRVEAEDIQNMCEVVFSSFLPSSSYSVNDVPELEYYHDNIVDYYVPII